MYEYHNKNNIKNKYLTWELQYYCYVYLNVY